MKHGESDVERQISPTTHNTSNILLCLGMHHVLYIGYIQHNQYKLTLWLGQAPIPPFQFVIHKSIMS